MDAELMKVIFTFDIPLDVTVKPVWKPVPVTPKENPLLFFAFAGLLLVGELMVGLDRALTVNVNDCGTVPPILVAVNVIG